ncbi:MAG: hypothetical protein AB7I04_07970 [Pseudomonadales bacterium]
MTPQDALFAIAEISIGLAGFSGLVAAFVQHEGQTWRADQKTRIVMLIVLSFGVIVCALTPYALSGVSASPALIWGVPLVVFSTLCIGLLIYWIVVSRRHSFQLLFPVISIPVLTVATVLQVVAFLSGVGLLFPYSSTILVLGFLSVLVFGANMFLALLYSIWK